MSSFEDAFTQSLISSMNPMNGIAAQMAQETIKEKRIATATKCQEFVKELRTELTEAIASGEDKEVLDSLRRLIKEFS